LLRAPACAGPYSEPQDGEDVLAIKIRYNPVDRASGGVLIQDIDQAVMA
jgi:hypothetical protein